MCMIYLLCSAHVLSKQDTVMHMCMIYLLCQAHVP